jgi:hypothetical protein
MLEIIVGENSAWLGLRRVECIEVPDGEVDRLFEHHQPKESDKKRYIDMIAEWKREREIENRLNFLDGGNGESATVTGICTIEEPLIRQAGNGL